MEAIIKELKEKNLPKLIDSVDYLNKKHPELSLYQKIEIYNLAYKIKK